MTAEVAILNCSGIALAADSAVTVGNQKIYNSALKLFALSKVAPVAIMIYGTATLSRVPWELIIKEFRRDLGSKTCDTIDDYAELFVKYIRSHTKLFSEETDQAWINDRVGMILEGTYAEATGRAEKAFEDSQGSGITENELREIFLDTVKHQCDAISQLPSLEPQQEVVERLNGMCEQSLSVLGPHIFGDLFDGLREELLKCAQFAYANSLFLSPSTGIVIAGYGDQEMFPSTATLTFDGAVTGFVRYKVDAERTQKVSPVAMPASIIAFAQGEMVATFMEGINPAVKNYLQSGLDNLFLQLPGALLKALGEDNKELEEGLAEACSQLKEQLVTSAQEYRFAEHVMPVLGMVNSLPKDELAAMAESMVNLTAFKRRVTGDLETVGGPIDVCVISKGDGLVWVKRKHYFPPELNLLFQRNYLRETATTLGE